MASPILKIKICFKRFKTNLGDCYNTFKTAEKLFDDIEGGIYFTRSDIEDMIINNLPEKYLNNDRLVKKFIDNNYNYLVGQLKKECSDSIKFMVETYCEDEAK